MDLLEQIGGLEWGMSKTQFQEAFSDRRWEPEHPEMNAVGFHDVYAGFRAFVVGYFNDATGGLRRVVLACSGIPDAALKELHQAIVEKLTYLNGLPQHETQGDPTAPSEFRLEGMQIWNAPTSVISSKLSLSHAGSTKPGATVTWGDPKNDPASRRWATSGLTAGREPEALPENFELSDSQRDEIRKAMEAGS